MLLDQKVQLKWVPKYKKYYESKGYKYTVRGDTFEINIKDLDINSKVIIKYICDYCNNQLEKSYALYNKSKKNCIIKKDCCRNCIALKRKEANLKKYGVEYYSQIEGFKEQFENTCLKRYGVKSPMELETTKDKIKNTMIERYGVEHNMYLEETKNKIKQTNLKKYGVECPMQTEKVRNKVKQNNLKKYGVECALQSEQVRNKVKTNNLKKYGTEFVTQNKNQMDKILKKINKTMYLNGNTISSKQQRHLCNLLNGELNYPVDNCFLDIAFLDDMVYIEYDGSGHDLRVKLGYDKDKFQEKEIKRTLYLKNKGWKLIRIVSNKDLLPQDNELIKLINKAKKYLTNNHTWYEINIDENLIKCSEYQKNINFINLRKIN